MFSRVLIAIFLIFSTILLKAQSFDWAKKLGGSNDDNSASIAVDITGNIYTTGYFLGTADFDPGVLTTNLTAAGNSDIFVSKLDASGNFLWVKQMGGNSWDDATGITLDAAQNIYITGHFSGTVDFDPGVGTSNLTSSGNYDIFICKLDAVGNFLWAKKIGNNNGDYSWAICTSPTGESYITGFFFGTVDFNPGAGIFNLTSLGSYDFFILNLDAAGNFVWAKQIGGMNSDNAYAISLDLSGNIYTTGGFNGTVDFDPGAGVFNLSSAGSEDIFILKLDVLGNFVWAKTFGGTNFDSANSMTVDAFGNVYTIGTFEGTVDFDPNAGIANLTSSSFYDVFINKLDNAGNFIWAKHLAGANYEDAFSIHSDANGSIVFSGCFSSTVDFDPGAGVFNLTPAGTQDIFISMLDNGGNFLWTKDLKGNNNVGCGISILVDASNNIYTTGFFSSTVDFNPDAPTFNITASGQLDVFIHKMNYNNIPLPISLISFYGKKSDEKNILYWTTATEINNDYFTVLKSSDGNNFEKIGTMHGAGNSSQTLIYSFTDEHPFIGISYYQLQQTDFNNYTSFSKIIAIKNTDEDINLLIVSPNPAFDFIQISFIETTKDIFKVEITNSIGESVSYTENKMIIDVSGLPKGIYFLKVSDGVKSVKKKFIKQ